MDRAMDPYKTKTEVGGLGLYGTLGIPAVAAYLIGWQIAASLAGRLRLRHCNQLRWKLVRGLLHHNPVLDVLVTSNRVFLTLGVDIRLD